MHLKFKSIRGVSGEVSTLQRVSICVAAKELGKAVVASGIRGRLLIVGLEHF